MPDEAPVTMASGFAASGMAFSQPTQRNGPATIGEKRSRHVVLELAKASSVQKYSSSCRSRHAKHPADSVQSKTSFALIPAVAFALGARYLHHNNIRKLRSQWICSREKRSWVRRNRRRSMSR